MNPESSDLPTEILNAQKLKEFTIVSFVFVKHAYQLISIYKMNYCTDIVFFFWGGGGGQWGGTLIFGGAVFRDGRLSESGRSLDHLRYFTFHRYCTKQGLCTLIINSDERR